MNDTTVIQEKFDTIAANLNVLTDTITSTMARCEERLIAIEKLMWVVQRKLIDQDKLLDKLSSNTVIDQLVQRKEHHNRIKPLDLQSEEYRKSTGRAMREDYEDHDDE